MTKKTDGDDTKKARRKAKLKLESLAGIDVNTMTQKQKEDLLIVLLQLLNLANENGIIK